MLRMPPTPRASPALGLRGDFAGSPSASPSARLSPPAWLKKAASVETEKDLLAALDESIRAEARGKPRERREKREAAEAVFDRLNSDVLARSTASSAADQQRQSTSPPIAWVTTQGPGSYHELLYAEGMLAKAERARWRTEAEAVLEAQELLGCTFTPSLDAHSEELVAQSREYDWHGARPLCERVEMVISEQRMRRQALQENIEDGLREEMRPPVRASPRLPPGATEPSGTFMERVERESLESRLARQRLCSDTYHAAMKSSRETYHPLLSPRTEQLAIEHSESRRRSASSVLGFSSSMPTNRHGGGSGGRRRSKSPSHTPTAGYMSATSAANARQYRGPERPPERRSPQTATPPTRSAPPQRAAVAFVDIVHDVSEPKAATPSEEAAASIEAAFGLTRAQALELEQNHEPSDATVSSTAREVAAAAVEAALALAEGEIWWRQRIVT